MMNETKVTVVGNLTADPELRYTQNGIPVANFTVASTERVFDRNTQQATDGDKLFIRVAAWRDLGEHVANSFHKGEEVIVFGKLKNREYQKQDGTTGWSLEIEPEAVGASVRWGTTAFTKSPPKGQPTAQPAAPVAAAPAQPGPAPVTQPQYAAPAAQPTAQAAPQYAQAPTGNVESMPDDLF